MRPVAAQGFAVDVSEERSQVLVRVAGELDLVTAPSLDRHLDGAVARGRPLVVVDLAGVSFLDVRGLNSLVAAAAAANDAGSALVLRAAGPHVHRIVELCGLAGQLVFER